MAKGHVLVAEDIADKNFVKEMRFNILLEKKVSGVAELRYIMLYGKSQVNGKCQLNG